MREGRVSGWVAFIGAERRVHFFGGWPKFGGPWIFPVARVYLTRGSPAGRPIWMKTMSGASRVSRSVGCEARPRKRHVDGPVYKAPYGSIYIYIFGGISRFAPAAYIFLALFRFPACSRHREPWTRKILNRGEGVAIFSFFFSSKREMKLDIEKNFLKVGGKRLK